MLCENELAEVAQAAKAEGVLILVLLEYALRAAPHISTTTYIKKVLILVLLEYALRGFRLY